MADYNQAIRINPRVAEVWFNRAECWKAKGDMKQAESDYTRSIELKPNWAPAYAQRGIVRVAVRP
jgi:tetratricopeptide (TPR) repeat protein